MYIIYIRTYVYISYSRYEGNKMAAYICTLLWMSEFEDVIVSQYDVISSFQFNSILHQPAINIGLAAILWLYLHLPIVIQQ